MDEFCNKEFERLRKYDEGYSHQFDSILRIYGSPLSSDEKVSKKPRRDIHSENNDDVVMGVALESEQIDGTNLYQDFFVEEDEALVNHYFEVNNLEDILVQSEFKPYCQSVKMYNYVHHNILRKIPDDQKLFPGSKYTLKEMAMGVLTMRQQYSNRIGDQIMTAMFAFNLEMSKEENSPEEPIKETSYTMFQLLMSIITSSDYNFPSYNFPKCQCGMFTFAGDNRNQERCNKCNVEKVRKGYPVYHYLPFAPRLSQLLRCKLTRKFFNYEEHREVEENIITDIFDGTNWKRFKQMMGDKEKLIGLEMSWDGVNPFDNRKDSMWPVFLSILNFPSTLRSQIHCGLHMVAIDDGGYCVFDALVKEFNDLWRNGIVVNGERWRVAIIRFVCDGKGLEKFTKTQGSNSLAGCNVCHFKGNTWGDKVCYNHHRRYLPDGHELRGTTLFGFDYHFEEIEGVPFMRTYDEYIANGIAAPAHPDKNIHGVKGVWTFHELDYANHIFWIKDAMHTFANVITDCIKLLRPTTTDFENRTEKTKIRRACQHDKIFHPLYARDEETNNYLRAPWALTKHDIEGVHHRLSETLKAPENIRTILTNTTAKSHDKVVFATQYAREALRNVNRYASQVMENMMELFDMMGHLLQYRFHPIEDIDEALEELVLILSKREGLLPPSESTYTVHEMIHIVTQIKEVGPPLMSSMWKYERKNKFLKGLIKNTASYIASLVKNYLLSESVAFLISADINLHSKMKEAFQSIDPNAIKNISGTIKAIKKLKFDPIRKIISCNPFDDINEVDDDNEDDINQEFLNFLSE
jgi:hypothetical protein